MTKLLDTLTRYSNGTNTHEDKDFLYEVMNAAGFHIQKYDSITDVALYETDGKYSATIDWFWSARQCGNNECDELGHDIIMAADPIKTANIMRITNKRRDSVWRMQNAESQAESYSREIMRLDNELAEWEAK